MRVFAAVFAIFSAQALPAIAAEIDIEKGRLSHVGNYSSQVVAVKNNTSSAVQTIKVECGFFQKGTLQAAGMGFAQGIRPNQTAYVEVIANNSPGTDSADCRVSSVQ